MELLGVARLLARRERVTVSLADSLPLSAFLRRVVDEVPALVGTVISEDGALLGGHVLSRRGQELLRNPEDPIRGGDELLLLSLSAGG